MEQDRTKNGKKSMIDAMIKSLGIVQTACNSVGISRETHYKWLKEDEEYRSKIDDIDNISLDFAESQLLKQIKDGNTAATIFYLKTKGKKRGYIEKSQIEIETEKPIFKSIDLSVSSDNSTEENI